MTPTPDGWPCGFTMRWGQTDARRERGYIAERLAGSAGIFVCPFQPFSDHGCGRRCRAGPESQAFLLRAYWAQRIGSLAVAAVTGCVSASVAVLAVPMLVPGSSAEMHLLVAALGASCGQKTFDVLMRRVLGLSVVDFRKPEELRGMMTPEERCQHVEQCPFHHEHEEREERAKNGRK